MAHAVSKKHAAARWHNVSQRDPAESLQAYLSTKDSHRGATVEKPRQKTHGDMTHVLVPATKWDTAEDATSSLQTEGGRNQES